MDVDEYTRADATELAELIRTGQVSAGEAATAARTVLDAVEPTLNAVVEGPFDTPLAHAEDGPFAGVPFVVKDLVLHAEGVPHHMGSRLLGPGVPFPYDSELMRRFRAAGLATIGVSAAPEFGFSTVTEPVFHGPTRNPWDPQRSPGGSSGGSAALVAAGVVPVAHANDGGGSIRIPAAFSGLVGLKPSRGRVSPGPDYADPLFGLGVEFALTRTVRDSAGLFDAVHGAAPGDGHLLPDPPAPYRRLAEAGSRPLRIAVSTAPLCGPLLREGRAVDPACSQAVRDVAAALEQLGHHVEEAAPALDAEAFDDANLKVWCSFLADGLAGVAAALGVTPGPDTVEATTLACAEYGASLSALDLYAVERVFNTVTRGMAAFHQDYDLLLTPTAAVPNVAIGELRGDDPSLGAQGWYDAIFTVAPFTALANVTGNPAISLPMGTSPEGWPVGVQFSAPYADEATLLALAGDLERAHPWSTRRAPVLVG
ncbi:amidase [Egicoccus halophilus]|uniref:6-aminohexanoate-cyclic-dimer hydrolase n=1 Tax=Egicoccus halophilus TaxID=1670830 RepID=A0A8J3ETN4_9ACTN|nr:amidase family protein [Egicoccus halophilus]GGI05528.1 6-aminohexanoate-cyclic-dimer hydrolase [Egicoccus halophilus]